MRKSLTFLTQHELGFGVIAPIKYSVQSYEFRRLPNIQDPFYRLGNCSLGLF
jgi:hypothetical protein